MINIGTPLSHSATKLLLLGAGELGKEVAIEAQRLGIEVIAVDRYVNAPAMQVAHKCHVTSMLDEKALRSIIEKEKPNFIVPEIEAISTHVLIELEKEGFCIIPTAKAVALTMNREGLRRLASEELKLTTSPYQFANNFIEYQQAVKSIGLPCVVKPIMSSSGRGQSIIHHPKGIDQAWHTAQFGARVNTSIVIVEAFIPFDYEITLLTIRHVEGTLFCAPIGHEQVNGDYRESWQPHPMPSNLLKKAEEMARKVTDALGGYGLFGVEFFVKDQEIYFSEVSPRPHDTGLVTLISQDLSQFSLHVRTILGLPIPALQQIGHGASRPLLAKGHGKNIRYYGLDKALNFHDTRVHLFGKPEVNGERRVGVVLSLGNNIISARKKAQFAHDVIRIEVN
jgi:phosphoribosylglycinamide formyltransferase 2